MAVWLSGCLAVWLSGWLSSCLSVRPSVRLSVCPSVRLSVCLSVRPSVLAPLEPYDFRALLAPHLPVCVLLCFVWRLRPLFLLGTAVSPQYGSLGCGVCLTRDAPCIHPENDETAAPVFVPSGVDLVPPPLSRQADRQADRQT